MRRLRKALIGVLLALVVVGSLLTLAAAVTPQGKTAWQTILFALQTLDAPVQPQPWFTPDPIEEEVHFAVSDGTGRGTLYRPPDGRPRAAVLLFLGAMAAGDTDPDVIRLGRALARSGYVAMFYWSPTMSRQPNIDPVETENLTLAFQHLASRDYVDAGRVGLGGFCVGASFALVAAADPRIAADVGFINAFGPYFDAGSLLRQAASRTALAADGQPIAWRPDSLTLRVLANELIETLDDPEEAALLRGHYIDNAPAPPARLEALSPPAAVVHRLLSGTTPAEAEILYRRLPEDFRREMARLSPASHLAELQAPVLLLHDRNDRLVPAQESRQLAAALAGQTPVRYTELLGFDHVRPDGSGGWQLRLEEGARFFRHMYGIIRAAH